MNSPPSHLARELSELGYRFMQRLFQEAKGIYQEKGVSPMKAHLLGLLARGVDAPTALSEGLEAHPSQVSHLVSALEAEGLLERSLDPKDRRRRKLRLTPQGEALHQELEEAWLKAFARFLARLEEEEILLLRDLLRKLTGGEDA